MHPHGIPQHRARQVLQDVVASDTLAPSSTPLASAAHTTRRGPPIDKQPELGKSDVLGKLVNNKPRARAHSPTSPGAGALRKN